MPYISLDNARFLRRHQVSCVLAGWLDTRLEVSERKGAPRLRDVLSDRLDAEETRTILHDLDAWLTSEMGKVAIERATEMSRALPAGTALRGNELVTHVRREIGGWVEQVAGRWANIQDRFEFAEKDMVDAETEDLKSRALGRMKRADGEKKRYLLRAKTALAPRGVAVGAGHIQGKTALVQINDRPAKCLISLYFLPEDTPSGGARLRVP
jgi:hypothetical protein